MVFELFRQTLVKPLLQIRAAFSGSQVLNTESDFSKGDHAREERLRVGGFEPADDLCVRLRFSELRDDVRIDQESAHKSTGRG